MKCKNHPSRQAEHFCASCGIPLCNDCAEEAKPEEYYCFQCAMLSSVSQVGTKIKDRRDKAVEEKLKEKKKWGPFRYFIVSASVLIVVMWGVIIFGGEKAPATLADVVKNERAFLFLVDSAVKRYAHYEGNKYPDQLSNLVPKYLRLREDQLPSLSKLSYQKDSAAGYRLSLVRAKPGEMMIILSPKGVEYKTPAAGGA